VQLLETARFKVTLWCIKSQLEDIKSQEEYMFSITHFIYRKENLFTSVAVMCSVILGFIQSTSKEKP